MHPNPGCIFFCGLLQRHYFRKLQEYSAQLQNSCNIKVRILFWQKRFCGLASHEASTLCLRGAVQLKFSIPGQHSYRIGNRGAGCEVCNTLWNCGVYHHHGILSPTF